MQKHVALTLLAVALPLLIGGAAPPGREDLEDPSKPTLHFAGTLSIAMGGRTAGLLSTNKCATDGDFIVCLSVWTASRQGSSDYQFGPPLSLMKLVDNYHLDHPFVRGSFLNGLGDPQEIINLVNGDKVWVKQEFRRAPRDDEHPIKSVTLVTPGDVNYVRVDVLHPDSDTRRNVVPSN